ncbi:type II toxin-antitoxin system HicB family antitoxin [Lelliottia aquatilis]|uniref:type II toxin-antitoxin system HicB family antitoxin n=1 Tax=Lelliottia aquatilis TaxID=2080838 RepID=UPI001576703E|nr:type II toxin-antitoxin system HicB family antitoxin [Lelliottia aquatilis]NTZ48351.1 type II toxin-antitoxin system HicB family antitoxin [Lelliottia aquatilis]
MFYPAYIHKTEVGSGYSGFFPGVPGCVFAGDSFEEALADAHSALNDHFEFSADEGYEIPEGEPMENYLTHEDCQGGIWAGVTIDMTKFDSKAKRVQITMSGGLLSRIDSAVSAGVYSSRSGFLADAARHELARRS